MTLNQKVSNAITKKIVKCIILSSFFVIKTSKIAMNETIGTIHVTKCKVQPKIEPLFAKGVLFM